MARVYEEKPLNVSNSTNTRVIQISREYASKPDGKRTIACRMLVMSLDFTFQYTALSYMWGDPTCKREILLEGKPFWVTSNLFDFLEMYSQADDDDLLWIDALCIDQENITERNHQVALMGRIYNSANHVLVWLGKGDAELLENLEKIKHWNEPWQLDFSRGQTTPEKDQIDAKLKNVERVWKHSYWERAWIWQEVVLSREFSIRCGPIILPGSKFQLFFQDVSYHTPMDNILSEIGQALSLDAEPTVVKILKERVLRRACDGHYIHPWEDDHKAGCSDIRDRIYSMIALMDPAIGIIPDYNRTKSELFIDIISNHLENDHTYRFLCLMQNLLYILEIEKDDDTIRRYIQGGKFGDLLASLFKDDETNYATQPSQWSRDLTNSIRKHDETERQN